MNILIYFSEFSYFITFLLLSIYFCLKILGTYRFQVLGQKPSRIPSHLSIGTPHTQLLWDQANVCLCRLQINERKAHCSKLLPLLFLGNMFRSLILSVRAFGICLDKRKESKFKMVANTPLWIYGLYGHKSPQNLC